MRKNVIDDHVNSNLNHFSQQNIDLIFSIVDFAKVKPTVEVQNICPS